jgi:hypothetical protein
MVIDKGKIRVGKNVPVPFSPPSIRQELIWDRTKPSAVIDQPVTFQMWNEHSAQFRENFVSEQFVISYQFRAGSEILPGFSERS